MRLLYFAPVSWDSYAQRPHAFVEYFLERGGEAALWVNPYPTRLPSLKDVYRLKMPASARAARPPGLDVLDAPAWPIEPIPASGWLHRLTLWGRVLSRIEEFAAGRRLTIGVGRPSKLALLALRQLSPIRSFYDAMDDFPEFATGVSRLSMRRTEDKIARRVGDLYVCSSGLALKFSRRGLVPLRIPNACGVPSLPSPVRRVGEAVVLGYIGTMAAWFDWDPVLALARALPDATMRLIGPSFLPPPRDLPRNVEIHPECAHEEAVEHLTGFSAGLIPFRKTPLTACVDPIKYYEYRAMGLPILSTRFGEMAGRGEKDGVFFLDRGEGMDAVVRRALEHAPEADGIGVFRRENDWWWRFGQAGLFAELGGQAAKGAQ